MCPLFDVENKHPAGQTRREPLHEVPSKHAHFNVFACYFYLHWYMWAAVCILYFIYFSFKNYEKTTTTVFKFSTVSLSHFALIVTCVSDEFFSFYLTLCLTSLLGFEPNVKTPLISFLMSNVICGEFEKIIHLSTLAGNPESE